MQQTNTMITATFPCTITGIRWDLSTTGDTDILDRMSWVIAVLRESDTVSTIAIGNNGDMYVPEQNVIAFGMSKIQGNDQVITWRGATKSMRKLMGGDRIIISALNSAAAGASLVGVVQFFCQT